MKTTIPLLVLLLAALVIGAAIFLDPKPIVQLEDYQQFIDPSQQENTVNESNISFWSTKLKMDPKSVTYKLKLASNLGKRFKLSGNVNDLLQKDSLLESSLSSKVGQVSVYHALSAQSITKHEFVKAKEYALKALDVGEKKDVSHYLLFDAEMELGNYFEAAISLDKHENKSTFDYLLRASKLEDAMGDLDKAIDLMEKAVLRVKDTKEQYVWGLSNLADMYGHAGKVEKSYKSYLEVLSMDPQHYHSLQGIAWLAYSNDGNTVQAKRILHFIEAKSSDPQIKLMLAEIAEFEMDEKGSSELKESYLKIVSIPAYEGMYNKYRILLESDNPETKLIAINRATKEVEKRPTAEMYDLLAWSYLQNNEESKALELVSQYVEGQSSEPEVLYHLGMVYKRNNKREKGNYYLKQALESKLELGPLTSKKIRAELI